MNVLVISPVADLETLHLLLGVQECRFTTPSQDAGTIVLSMVDGILTHLP
jgi:phage baseplate assembly protein gpV